MNSRVRRAVWAGQFYPGDAEELRAAVAGFVASAQPISEGRIKAVVAPHAGYRYSGPIAGSAFRPLADAAEPIERIVLLGPSHRVAFDGIARGSASAFETPLGQTACDPEAAERLSGLACVRDLDEPHGLEHSLEVELPFLQHCLKAFRLVPLVVGETEDAELADAIDALWGGPETRFVISTDLSHYLDHRAARQTDEATARAIESLTPEDIGPHQACGRFPLRGFLHSARRRGMRCQRLDLRNSGDTAGPRGQVVGYGAFGFFE